MKIKLFPFLVLLAESLAAQVSPEWRWAILPLRVEDPLWTGAAANIGKSLARVLEDGKVRIPTETDVRRWQTRLFEGALREKNTAEATTREAWDRSRLIHSVGSLEELRARTAFERARADRLRLEESGPAPVTAREPWPLRQWPSPGSLADRPTVDPKVWAEANALAAFVEGSLRELRGYLGLRIRVLDPDYNELAAWEEWMSPEELPERLLVTEGWLRGVLLARPWSRLAIRATPQTAEIWVGDTLRGLGAVDLGIVDPATLLITIRESGHKTWQETVELGEGKEVRLDRTLERLPAEPLRVVSVPEGADVWVGGVWVGQTPLEVPRTGRRLYVELILDGYDSVAVTALPDTEEVSFTLTPTAPRPTIREARDWFYLALGSFTLSFFTTVMFRGFETEYAQLANDFVLYYNALPVMVRTQAMLDRVHHSYTFQQIFQNGGYALMGVTAVLFGWTVWELFRYIQVSEGGG